MSASRCCDREHDLGGADRLAVFILHGHLALGVGTELGLLAGMARIGQQFEDLVAVEQRRRHQRRCLAAGIAEHDALVACAFILVARGVDALRDVRRLRVQQHFDIRSLPVKAFLLIADVFDRVARDFDDLFFADMPGSARFAGDDHAVGRCHRFAGGADVPRRQAALGPFAEKQIDDFIGDAVADLVRMAFGHALAGEKVILTRHRLEPFVDYPCGRAAFCNNRPRGQLAQAVSSSIKYIVTSLEENGP